MKTKQEFELASAAMQLASFFSGMFLMAALSTHVHNPENIYVIVSFLFGGMSTGSVAIYLREKFKKGFA